MHKTQILAQLRHPLALVQFQTSKPHPTSHDCTIT